MGSRIRVCPGGYFTEKASYRTCHIPTNKYSAWSHIKFTPPRFQYDSIISDTIATKPPRKPRASKKLRARRLRNFVPHKMTPRVSPPVIPTICSGSNSGQKMRQPFKAVSHTKKFNTFWNDGVWSEFQYLYQTTTRYEYVAYNGWLAQFNPITTLPSLSEMDMNMIGAAFRKIQPNFDSYKVDGINIYTVILELSDLRQLFSKTVLRFTKSLSTIAEKNLLVNFAILPLIGDIQAMYDIITKLNKAIDIWNDGAAKGVTFDFHETIYSYNNQTSRTNMGTTYGFPAICYQMSDIRYTTRSSVAKAHLYARPLFIDDEDRKDIHMSALGIDRPVLGVWEAVPFSWAIDYFLHVDKIISAWDKRLPSLFKYEFVDAGLSLKQSATTYDEFVVSPRTTSYANKAYYSILTLPSPTVRSIGQTKFERQPVSLPEMNFYMSRPDDYKLGWDKGWRQASYLASVAYLLLHSRK